MLDNIVLTDEKAVAGQEAHSDTNGSQDSNRYQLSKEIRHARRK